MANFETIKSVLELFVMLVGGPFAVVIWYLIKRALGEGAAMRSELSAYKLHVSENYSTKHDLSRAMEQFTRAVDAVFLKLDRIDSRLDRKADKAGGS